MSSATSQQFCVRWNSHLGSLGAAFPQLLAGQRFVDVTLACEGHQLHCHRLVLAACSTYFESLLGENPCKHPIIILPRDIKLWEIQALVDFMYKGEVNVSQAGLSDLLKCAEILQIRGLCGSDAALNLNQVNSASVQCGTTSASLNFVNSVSSNAAATANNLPTASTSQSSTDTARSSSSTPSQQDQIGSIDQDENVTACSSSSSKNFTDRLVNASSHNNRISTDDSEQSLLLKNVKNEKLKADELQQSKERHRTSTPNRMIDKIEPVDISMDEDADDEDLGQTMEKSLDSEAYSAKFTDYLEGAKGANQHHLTQTQQQLQPENLGNLSTVPQSSTLPASTSISRSAALTINNINLDNYTSGNCDFMNANGSATEENRSFFNERGDVYIIKDVDNERQEEICIVEQDQYKAMQKHTRTNRDIHAAPHATRLSFNKSSGLVFGNETGPARRTNFGKIRVKSNENLFGSQEDSRKSKCPIKKQETFLQKDNRNEEYEIENTRSRTLLSVRNSKRSLPGALRFNRNSMTVFIKPAKESLEESLLKNEQSEKTRSIDYESTPIKSEFDAADNYENIVCLPNVLEMYNDSEEVELSIEEETGVHSIAHADYEDIKIGNEIMYAQTINSPTGILGYASNDVSSPDHETSHHYNGLEICGTNGRPVEFAMAQILSNHMISNSDKNGDQSRDLIMSGRSTLGTNATTRRCRYISNNRLNTNAPDRVQSSIEPTLSAVVLRNPRSNQPRTYSNDALYAALMDVKAGESIYRASQIHKVPRKTLRNWMKRWHIKSAYPMPRQLKQAAEKKKRIQQQLERAVANDALNSSAETASMTIKDFSNFNHCAKNEFPLANVICEYDNGGLQTSTDNMQGRRIRRSEALLRQAAEFVSRGQTFQTVSDTFGIPISTIRFFMARKGILPRRKRGRSAGITLPPLSNSQQINSMNDNSNITSSRINEGNISHSRSASPSEPPFHFATYKLPELKPKLV